ncbi:MAG: hypothetical protein QN147_06530 [Armatimonadota bacterium]|nr:hypothetical protein [Armatimonadota bacterium]
MSTVTLVVALAVVMVFVLAAAGVGAFLIVRNLPAARPAAAPVPVQPNPAPSPAGPPVQPHQPAQPPAPPAAADAVAQFAIAAVSPTEVGPSEPVKLKMTFVFNGREKTKLPMQLAWRGPDNELTYGKVYEEDVSPGPNTSEGWSFRSGATALAGTRFRLYGVARVDGKSFITESPVVVTVTGTGAQPAPPSGAEAITQFAIIAASPTEVPPGEAVRFRMTFVFNGREKTKLQMQLAWRKGGGDLTYGKVYEEDISPGPNTSQGWSFRSAADTPAGTTFQIFGVIHAGGKTFVTEAPAAMSVTGAAAQPAPAPQPGPGPLPAPQPVPGIPRTGPPIDPAVEMNQYTDPGRRFTMNYPAGWRVQTIEGGFVAFFKDHPDEGTSFLVHPWATMQGTQGGRQVAQMMLRTFQRRYPDVQVIGQDHRALGQGGVRVDVAILEIVWTNVRGERMRGRTAIVAAFVTLPGIQTNQTTIHFWHYQAPEVAWEAMTPVFTQMYQSYSGLAYVTSPP